MSHHNHSHHNHKENGAQKNILLAFSLNLLFVLVEIVGGLITNSFAILSDAIHDFGDCISIGFAYVFEKLSHKEPDENYTFGYRRYSLVSAVITSTILLAGSVGIIIGSVERITEPREIQGLPMVIIAVFGLVINGIAAYKTSKGMGLNERAISLHMLEDVLGWAAVLAGSILIYFFQWYFVDTLLSFFIAGFLVVHSIMNLREVFVVLLEKRPERIDSAEYRTALLQIDGVENVHDLHVWSLDGERALATMHLRVHASPDVSDFERIKGEAYEISEQRGITHITVQLDFTDVCENSNCGH